MVNRIDSDGRVTVITGTRDVAPREVNQRPTVSFLMKEAMIELKKPLEQQDREKVIDMLRKAYKYHTGSEPEI